MFTSAAENSAGCVLPSFFGLKLDGKITVIRITVRMLTSGSTDRITVPNLLAVDYSGDISGGLCS